MREKKKIKKKKRRVERKKKKKEKNIDVGSEFFFLKEILYFIFSLKRNR